MEANEACAGASESGRAYARALEALDGARAREAQTAHLFQVAQKEKRSAEEEARAAKQALTSARAEKRSAEKAERAVAAAAVAASEAELADANRACSIAERGFRAAEQRLAQARQDRSEAQGSCNQAKIRVERVKSRLEELLSSAREMLSRGGGGRPGRKSTRFGGIISEALRVHDEEVDFFRSLVDQLGDSLAGLDAQVERADRASHPSWTPSARTSRGLAAFVSATSPGPLGGLFPLPTSIPGGWSAGPSLPGFDAASRMGFAAPLASPSLLTTSFTGSPLGMATTPLSPHLPWGAPAGISSQARYAPPALGGSLSSCPLLSASLASAPGLAASWMGGVGSVGLNSGGSCLSLSSGGGSSGTLVDSWGTLAGSSQVGTPTYQDSFATSLGEIGSFSAPSLVSGGSFQVLDSTNTGVLTIDPTWATHTHQSRDSLDPWWAITGQSRDSGGRSDFGFHGWGDFSAAVDSMLPTSFGNAFEPVSSAGFGAAWSGGPLMSS